MGPPTAPAGSLPVLAVGFLLALLTGYRFALAHAAIAAVSRTRLRTLAEEGNRRAEVLAALLGRRDAVQASLRFGYSACLVLGAVLAWWLAQTPELARLAPPAAWAFAALLLFALGAELLPRVVASIRPEGVALRQARWVAGTYRLFGAIGRAALREEVPAREDPDEDAADSLRELMDATPLRPTQRRRITEILEFPDKTAAEVMVPRIDITGVPAELPLTDVAAEIVRSGYSRLPVFGDSKDDVIGLAHARDVLAWLPAEGVARDVCRRSIFVGETIRLDQLLRELRAQHSSVAIVVDEYGGTAGMVTVEDIIEEIVGEIHDETDPAEQGIRPRPEGGWLVPARTTVEELAERLGLGLGLDDEINTVGGMMMALAGDLPEPGEVTVTISDDRRLLWLTIGLDGARITDVAVVVREGLTPSRDDAEEESGRDEVNQEGAVAEFDGGVGLPRVRRALGLEPGPDEGAQVEDLFAFWPTGRRRGHEVRWQSHRVTALAETEDGRLTVRFEPQS